MPNQISEINVDNQNYNMVGAVAKGTCSSAATDWNKVVTLEAGCSVAQDMMLQVKFDHGCTVGDSQRKTIYSSDQVNYYSDSAMTVPVTLAPETNRTITYTGGGSAYYYVTFPTISVTGTNIQNKPICDSRGHTAGTGCFNDDDKMLFRYDGECCMIQNSDVRQKSSEYTIMSDGRIEHKPFFYKKGKEVTLAEIETYLGLNRTYKGYHVICTCYEQGSTSYAEGILIDSQWIAFHNNYIFVAYNSNKLTVTTTIAGQENNVCWNIYPIEVVSM